MHLTAEEFVDFAEGARDEASAPHLAACDACRVQLAELRSTLTLAAGAEVPEPPPLYWTRLSARVRDAIADDSTGWWEAWVRPGLWASIAAAVIVLAAVGLWTNAPARAPRPSATVAVAAARPAGGDLLGDATVAADPSLRLVAELTDDMDWDAAHEAGLATEDSAEHAVTHMSDAELRELRKLIEDAMKHPGA